MKKNLPFLVVLLILAIGACKKDKDSDDIAVAASFNEKELLENWTNNLIVPSYKLYKQRVEDLNTAAINYSANPSIQNLRILQEAHSAAYISWQTVSVFEFGPAADLSIKAHSNTFPCDTNGVNRKIINSDFDLSSASELDKKGFPALDFILFAKSENDIIKSKLYIKILCKDLSDKSSTVLSKWSESNGYASQFISNEGTSAGSSISLMINAINQHLERYHREAKFAIPSGARSFSKTPMPGHVEGVYENISSLTLAEFNMNSIKNIYLGLDLNNSNKTGLDDFVKFNDGETLNSDIETQIDVCISNYKKYSVALSSAVINNKTQVETTIKELQKLAFLLKADLPAKLGVLITYQDSDGD